MPTRPFVRRPAPPLALLTILALTLADPGAGRALAAPPAPGPADGLDATVTVCPGGCDHTSIQAAVTAAQLGDTVFIGSGTYKETVTIDKSLTLRGVGPKVAIVDGNGQGPVITVRPGVGAAISGLSVIGGRAASGAGIYNGGALNLSDCVVSGNATNSATEGWGGGVFNYGGVMNVTECTIADNRGRLGGAIINAFGTLVLSNSRLTGNTAAKYGGALHNGADASVRFDTVLLADNKVDAAEPNGRGGGIFSAGFTYVSRSTFTGNYAPEFGGAVFQYQDTIILANSTVSANTADVGGGAIYIAGGSMLVTNGTFVNNRGSFGAIWSNDTVTLRNSLLGNNPGGSCFGEITSIGYNLDSGNSCSFRSPGDLVNVNPRIGPLADNGGLTPTYAIGADSPAVDAGDPLGCTAPDDTLLGTDQRGALRPVDGNGDGVKRCDIGAFEYQPDAPYFTTPTPTPVPVPPGAVTVCASGCQHTSVRAAVAAAPSGGTVFIQAGTYVESVAVDKSLTLQGAGQSVAEIDGNRTAPVLTVAAGTSVTVRNLGLVRGQGVVNAGTLTLQNATVAYNASPTTGGIRNTGTLNVLDSVVASNVSLEDNGGGIYSNGGTVTVRGSTIAGNAANGKTGDGFGGAVYARGGSLTVEDSTIGSNESRQGAGIAGNNSQITLRGTTISGNRGQFGGGVYTYLGQTSVTGGAILGNTAGLGGGIYAYGPVTLTNARVAQNVVSGQYGYGGGVMSNGASVTVSGGSISDNEALQGGAMYAYKPDARIKVDNATLSGNKASYGGAISLWQGEAALTGVTLQANAAYLDGGGVFAQEGKITLRTSQLVGNTCDRNGGGLYVAAAGSVEASGTHLVGGSSDGSGAGAYVAGQLVFEGGNIADNVTSDATSFGGGVFNDGGRVTLRRAAIVRNTAADGGGIANRGALQAENVTLSGNRATRGAGLRNAAGGTTLVNVTIADNALEVRVVEPTETPEPTDAPEPTEDPAPAGAAGPAIAPSNLARDRSRARPRGVQQDPGGAGGAIHNSEGIVRLHHTVLGPSIDVGSCSGRLYSDGYNLDAGTTCGLAGTGDRSGVDLRLSTLVESGGTWIHGLVKSSPALDGGNPAGCRGLDGAVLAVDQRGRPRPVDGDGDGTARCDVGAVESELGGYVAPTPTPAGATPTGPTPTGPTPTGATPLAPTPTATPGGRPHVFLPLLRNRE